MFSVCRVFPVFLGETSGCCDFEFFLLIETTDGSQNVTFYLVVSKEILFDYVLSI